MNFERKYLSDLQGRLLETRRFIQVVAGPRQVGKTTMVQQLLQKLPFPSHYAAADAVVHTDAVWIEQQWETARIKQKQAESPEFILAIDEIQKISNWSEIVKRLWDEDTRLQHNMKVILLGSSRVLLQQGLTESLAGRFELSYIGHWSFTEMHEAFGWSAEQFVWFGGYPGGAELIQDEERWKRYISEALIETSISKDILMLTRVDKPALLRQLFELVVSIQGKYYRLQKIVGQLQDAGNTTTLSNYLTLLGQAGLLSGLEKYAGSKISQRGSSPKFQVHNTALLSAQQGYSLAEARVRPDYWGRLVESAIGAYLLNCSLRDDFRIFYWRDGNYEVDFVLEKKGKVIGLEVKSGASRRNPGMAVFQKKFQPQRVLLIGDTALPWDTFLSISPNDLF